MAERCAPELLPYPEELVDRVMERIKTQVSNILSLYLSFVIYDMLFASSECPEEFRISWFLKSAEFFFGEVSVGGKSAENCGLEE